MLVNVPEKPCPITFASPSVFTVPSASVTFVSGIPATRPSINEIAIIARNG